MASLPLLVSCGLSSRYRRVPVRGRRGDLRSFQLGRQSGREGPGYLSNGGGMFVFNTANAWQPGRGGSMRPYRAPNLHQFTGSLEQISSRAPHCRP